MPPLPIRPSVSPLPSYASRPYAARPVGFVTALKAIIAWWRGKPPNLRQSIREREIVELLVEELEAEPSADLPKVRGKSSKI